ncbi:MAG: tetratricopeptide repeat protein [Candidatus Saccharibacteria bacterium]|nr:tetratricopeptide repeat protein [Candidatus Saccharibacteria bacterium]
MVAVVAMICMAVFIAFFVPLEAKEKPAEEKSPKYAAQMKKLWQVAQTSMKEHKPSRAEKALLTILKFDEKNAAAYNRLGILYAKSKKFDEAVECFEIAQSLDNNPASIHNAGLIYLETGAYEKAEMAFEQAIELEGDVPARFMALAKTEEKLGRPKKAIEALENAYELDPSVSTLRQILAIYENMGDTEAATATTARIEEKIAEDNLAKQKKARKMMRGGSKVVMNTRAAAMKATGSKLRSRVGMTNRNVAGKTDETAPRANSRLVSKRKRI